MNSSEINTICNERLGSWTNKLVQEHATPVLLLGVGHDHKSGQVVLLTMENIDDDELLLFTLGAAEKLKEKMLRGL